MSTSLKKSFDAERTSASLFDEAVQVVRQTVKAFRGRGAKAPDAIEQAALALDLSRCRVWQLHYRQPFTLRRAEYIAIMRARVVHLHREMAELDRLHAELRNVTRQAELKLAAEESAGGSGWDGCGVGWRRTVPAGNGAR